MKAAMSFDDVSKDSIIAPHRGFSPKAREVLLSSKGQMPKSSSDFDLRRRLMNSCSLRRRDSQGTSNSSPKTPSSTNSVEKVDKQTNEFDGIGNISKAHTHKLLGELGKTRSAGDVFRANGHIVDKKLFRTFQQDNIMRLPSMDSDLESTGAFRSLTGDDAVSPYPVERANQYEMTEKDRNVKKWLEKQSS